MTIPTLPSTRRSFRLTGNVLYLTKDAELLQAQLQGKTRLRFDPTRELLGNISTDEITPGWVCYYYDITLARYCLIGLRGGLITKDVIRNGGFQVLVSGPSKGCGSSRETAPYSELMAGIELIVASSIEKIYQQNAHNIGLLTTTNVHLLTRLEQGDEIPIHEFTQGLDSISARIVECNGLFAYNRKRLKAEVSPMPIHTSVRPMTLCEKILASHAVVNANKGVVGVASLMPMDALFVRTDIRFSHEYVTPMANVLFEAGFGKDAPLADPKSVFTFRDHLTLLDLVMPKDHRAMGLHHEAAGLATVQEQFASKHGVKLYGEVLKEGKKAGSEAICHNKVIEDIALPGQLIIGTDSHTCMAGALGCLAFGVGATDMANAWYTQDVRVRVPETVHILLKHRLDNHVSAMDIMLHLFSLEFFKTGKCIGKVLEFSGEGITHLPLDERATLTNMAVEAGAFTGIIEADETTISYLVAQRELPETDIRKLLVKADMGATYFAEITLSLSEVQTMVALPGDPRNTVPLRDFLAVSEEDTKVNIAYGGSCTGGKKTDIDRYASVLKAALDQGKHIPNSVQFFIQFGSQSIHHYAERAGYLEIFQKAGAHLVPPSCGACIKAGPGISTSPNEVTVAAMNRNFPGRSGPGKVYLANPWVVAASALAGKLALPETLLPLPVPILYPRGTKSPLQGLTPLVPLERCSFG